MNKGKNVDEICLRNMWFHLFLESDSVYYYTSSFPGDTVDIKAWSLYC